MTNDKSPNTHIGLAVPVAVVGVAIVVEVVHLGAGRRFSNAMIPMTTNSSVSVKPRGRAEPVEQTERDACERRIMMQESILSRRLTFPIATTRLTNVEIKRAQLLRLS